MSILSSSDVAAGLALIKLDQGGISSVFFQMSVASCDCQPEWWRVCVRCYVE